MIFYLSASTRRKLLKAYVDLLALLFCRLVIDAIFKREVTSRLGVPRALLLWGHVGDIWCWSEALPSLDEELLVLFHLPRILLVHLHDQRHQFDIICKVEWPCRCLILFLFRNIYEVDFIIPLRKVFSHFVQDLVLLRSLSISGCWLRHESSSR